MTRPYNTVATRRPYRRIFFPRLKTKKGSTKVIVLLFYCIRARTLASMQLILFSNMHIRKKENCFAQFHFFVFTNRYRSINEREMADFWSRSAQGKAAPIFCIKGICEVSCCRAKQGNGRTSSSRPASREATKKR